jgi:3-deoxy-D-manno-octulosonic-acid transferase
MRYLYSFLVYLARPFAFAVVLWRGISNRRYWVGLTERFGFGPPLPTLPIIWVHAVSLGEVTAAAPLIRALRARYPEMAVLLTTATPTGRQRAQNLFGYSISIRYLPYDTPGAMRRFVARAHPRLTIVLETELWPNLFWACRRRGTPVVLASARLSPKSVTSYRRFGSLFRGVFAGDMFVAAQTAGDAERFFEIGASRARMRVIGNLKYDVVIEPAVVELRAAGWHSRPVWIAGSTHAGEEDLVLETHASLLAERPDTLLLLAPRHPERFQSVAELLSRRGCRFERRSSAGAIHADCQVLLIDTVGELSALYAAADVAFVGGSLVPVGGHNLLEPASFGVPVITGPYQSNSVEIARLLKQAGAALEVADGRELTAAVKALLDDPERRQTIGACGREFVEAHRGGLERLMALIDSVMERLAIP